MNSDITCLHKLDCLLSNNTLMFQICSAEHLALMGVYLFKDSNHWHINQFGMATAGLDHELGRSRQKYISKELRRCPPNRNYTDFSCPKIQHMLWHIMGREEYLSLSIWKWQLVLIVPVKLHTNMLDRDYKERVIMIMMQRDKHIIIGSMSGLKSHMDKFQKCFLTCLSWSMILRWVEKTT